MAESLRRVVVTAGRSPLAHRVSALLRNSGHFDRVRRVEARARGRAGDAEEPDLDIVSFVPDHRPFLAYLEKEGIDTVVQCGLAPDRSGLGSVESAADVIATMCLGAAIGHEGSPVRSWVLASSSAVYPIDSHAPLVQHEGQAVVHEGETPGASIAEAEDYARDIAHRLAYLNVAILRLQQIASRDVRGPLASLLSRTLVPAPIGFDATIQLLHLDDAADALAFAARAELAGIYNVASSGVTHWSDAVRATGRTAVPVLPVGASLFEPLLAGLGVPHLPSSLIDALRFGHTVDTRKIELAGWQPAHDQRSCLAALRAKPHGDRARPVTPRTSRS